MAMADSELDPEDVLVVIGHPVGDIETTLAPFRYRNDEESRAAIQRGLVADPWPGSQDRPAT